MKSIPIVIVVILLAAGGVWFLTSRPEKMEVVPKEAQVKNAEMLETESSLTIIERDVNFVDGRREFFAEPLEPNPSGVGHPGVVMIHEWWGLNEHIKDMARELAGKGYKILAVDFYKCK